MHLDRFTIAATDVPNMVRFYNAVFGANLQVIPNTPFHAGKLGNCELLVCSNDVIQIDAKQNRIQMRFCVEDIEEVVRVAQASGGGAFGDRFEDDRRIAWGIHDPDGNSIELYQLKN